MLFLKVSCFISWFQWGRSGLWTLRHPGVVSRRARGPVAGHVRSGPELARDVEPSTEYVPDSHQRAAECTRRQQLLPQQCRTGQWTFPISYTSVHYNRLNSYSTCSQWPHHRSCMMTRCSMCFIGRSCIYFYLCVLCMMLLLGCGIKLFNWIVLTILVRLLQIYTKEKKLYSE